MADPEKQPEPRTIRKPTGWPDGLPKGSDERRQFYAELRAKKFTQDITAILEEFQKQNPQDFIMAKMLGSLRSLEKAMEKAEQACNRESVMKDRVSHAMALAKFQKQHLDTLKAIAKFMDTYGAKKKAGGNKSAAPGQQVGQAVTPPANGNGEKPICAIPSNRL